MAHLIPPQHLARLRRMLEQEDEEEDDLMAAVVAETHVGEALDPATSDVWPLQYTDGGAGARVSG